MGQTRYIHCKQCVEQKPRDMSTEKYARLNVSIEPGGLLIACMRHKKPVVLMTPEQLKEWMKIPPACDMCAKGIPHVH